MKLHIEHLPINCPPLAWVAQHRTEDSEKLKVWCGTQVEVGEKFVVEGVWPGSFSECGFERSDLFFGSGLKILEDRVCFVSSCAAVDRIWSWCDGATTYVSNSLPLLLAISDISLLPTEHRYAQWVQTVVRGRSYQRTYPVSHGQLKVHYIQNLELSNEGLREVGKPSRTEPFSDFVTYSAFMHETAEKIGRNARDPKRHSPVEILGTVSQGYDSPVATLMARTAGGRVAYTIRSARSIVPRDDSGAKICSFLGMECQEFTSDRDSMSDELWYWAANGSLQDMNFSVFDYPSGPSVLFTGFNGDMVWSMSGKMPSDTMVRKDTTGLGFCEHRLTRGVIHCPVPYWGIAQAQGLRAISGCADMRRWSVGGDYDRPVPRRLIEEAGVPRHLFGQVKSATSVDDLLLWPFSPELSSKYRHHLLNVTIRPPVWQITTIGRRIIDFWRGTFRERVITSKAGSLLKRRWRRQYAWEQYLFPWSNDVLKTELRRGIMPGQEDKPSAFSCKS